MKANAIVVQLQRVYSAVQAGFALFGLLVVSALVLLTANDGALLVSLREVGSQLSLAAEELQAPAAVSSAPVQMPAPDPSAAEQQALAQFIAKRYRIADRAAAKYVAIAYRAGAQNHLDPVLLLAVMAVESRYNPVAESGLGAQGLMQVMPKFHLEKIVQRGGERALLDPEVNIEVGAQILREYLRRFGDQELALQMYGGAFDEPTAQYAAKVQAERDRLEPVRQRARMQDDTQAAALTGADGRS